MRFSIKEIYFALLFLASCGRQSSDDLNSQSLDFTISANSWSAMSNTGAPAARGNHTSVWTGSKLMVWGGWSTTTGGALNTGGIYDPATDTWTAISTTGAPPAVGKHSAVWTGSKMIVWGGTSTTTAAGVRTGGIYDPATDTWTATTTTGAPSVRFSHSAVWTGSKMIVWGGGWYSSGLNLIVVSGDGFIYDPATDSWTAMPLGAGGRIDHSTIWTGTHMIVWAGWTGRDGTDFLTGSMYDAAANTWTTMGGQPPIYRHGHVAVWSGTKMHMWGGWNINAAVPAKPFDPASNTWGSLITQAGKPLDRAYHCGVWTGSKMLVWGGYAGGGTFGPQANGGLYNPATNTWAATSTTAAPLARARHTCDWTGSSMLVWGGFDNNNAGHSTGGIYTP